MKSFLKLYFPSLRHRVALMLILSLLLAYLVWVPFTATGIGLFDLFRFAGGHIFENAARGDYEYEHLHQADLNYYKMSPWFAVFPLSLLAKIPEIPGGIIWQILGFFIYFSGVASLFSALRLVSSGPPLWASLFFAVLLFWDLNINGLYLQSNAIIAGGMFWGMAFYHRERFLLSGLILAWVTNIKLVPLIAALLLMTGLQLRFISAYIGFLVLFFLAPALFFGWNGNLALHKSLFHVLAMDGNYRYGNEEVHFHYNIRAFLQSLFGLTPGPWFNFIPALIGGSIGLIFFLRRRMLDQSSFQLLVVLASTFILLFNTRTEGPSNVYLGPVYGIFFWNLLRVSKDRASRIVKIGLWVLFGWVVFTISFALTDLGKLIHLNRLVWEYNLRTAALAALFGVSFLSLFSKPLRQFLFREAQPTVLQSH